MNTCRYQWHLVTWFFFREPKQITQFSTFDSRVQHAYFSNWLCSIIIQIYSENVEPAFARRKRRRSIVTSYRVRTVSAVVARAKYGVRDGAKHRWAFCRPVLFERMFESFFGKVLNIAAAHACRRKNVIFGTETFPILTRRPHLRCDQGRS